MIEVFLGIDIGGSHIGVGCVSAIDGELLCSMTQPVYSYSSFENLVDLICQTILIMLNEEYLEGIPELYILSIGIGCPGQCKDGILIGACIFCKYLLIFSALCDLNESSTLLILLIYVILQHSGKLPSQRLLV